MAVTPFQAIYSVNLSSAFPGFYTPDLGPAGGTAVGHQISASAVKVHRIRVDNSANAAITILELHNLASLTVGTAIPPHEISVPASEANFVIEFPAVNGLTFATALSIVAVTARGGTTAPGAAVPCEVTTKA